MGLLLASDSDPQVQRALTHALAETTDTTAETVKDELREDALQHSTRSVNVTADATSHMTCRGWLARRCPRSTLGDKVL